jgi:uncharacterized membrane protein
VSPVGAASTVQAAKAASRYGFIDLLRGLALVVMIETHVVNAYLPTETRRTWFFFWLTFLNGLVAPTFLFSSGFSIMLQGKRQWDNWLHFRLPFWQQMRRLGFIALVAYYSHLDHFKLSKYLHPDEPGIWKNALQVDILQCIVASLLVVHVLIFLLRKPQSLAWGALVLAASAALVTPLVWARDFTGSLPLGLALFLNPHGISLFPLLPWISFILCGTVTAILFLRATEQATDSRFMRGALLVGIGLIILGLACNELPYTLPGHHNFYTTSPLYVMIRLGCVLIICAALYALEKFLRWVPKSIEGAGQESLLVYGVHLWIIFAFLRSKHVGPLLGLEAGYLGCFALSLAIIVFMLWLARQWHSLKINYRLWTKRAQFATVLAMIAVFLLR